METVTSCQGMNLPFMLLIAGFCAVLKICEEIYLFRFCFFFFCDKMASRKRRKNHAG